MNDSQTNILEQRGGLLRNEKGAVMVEFLVVFITFFTFLLCLFQIFQIYLAKVSVHRAANNAARSAAVVLPDHSIHYGGEQAYSISTGNLNTEPYLSWAGLQSNQRYGMDSPPRLSIIRTAAVYPLIPLYATGSTPEVKTRELNVHTAVVFPNSPGSQSLKRIFRPNEIVNVRVTHAYACNIPLANKLVCFDRASNFSGDFSFTGASVPNKEHLVISAESSFPLMDIGVLAEL